MIHVPVDMGSHELIRFIGHYEEKVETIKIIRDQSMDQYMVLVKFKEQEDADRFYASINGQQFNSLLEERCQLAYVGKVETPFFVECKFSVACMKQKSNFATWWRHFSGQSIKIAFFYHFSANSIAPPGGEI